MTKQLRLRNGDLVLGPGGFTTITGSQKVAQDLGVAVREVLGNDRFHPKWGTVIHTYLGGYSNAEAMMLVKAEITRVINNYITMQTSEITRDMDLGRKSRYSPEEIVTSVQSIETQSFEDRMNFRVSVGTANGQTIPILRTVEV